MLAISKKNKKINRMATLTNYYKKVYDYIDRIKKFRIKLSFIQ